MHGGIAGHVCKRSLNKGNRRDEFCRSLWIMHRPKTDVIKCSKAQVDPRVRLVVSLPSEFYYFCFKTVQIANYRPKHLRLDEKLLLER